MAPMSVLDSPRVRSCTMTGAEYVRVPRLRYKQVYLYMCNTHNIHTHRVHQQHTHTNCRCCSERRRSNCCKSNVLPLLSTQHNVVTIYVTAIGLLLIQPDMKHRG